MLQFTTSNSDKYSIAEEAQMAIEGGCKWIQVTKNLPAGVSQKDILTELKPLCEENEAFLMVDSDVDLTNEMRIHGVHLSKADIKPSDAREQLGPHAIIGVDVDSVSDIIALNGLDMDYVVLDFDKMQSIETIENIVNEVNSREIEIHIVVKGSMSLTEITALRRVGVAGVAISRQITDADDPVAATSEILTALSAQ